ncbi:MAG: hypothetical protein QNJ47_27885 [Nostocaceae cyanobacterium]|nr:hypothetical protein [Nostocaceae cyanobacterium]
MDILSDSISHILWHLPVDWTVVAQQVTDPNILGQMEKAFTNFVKSGQMWAMLIGFFIGYMFRNLTSFG